MRKSLAISAVLHAVALLWGMITFNASPFAQTEPPSVAVDFVDIKEFNKMTQGTPDAQKPEPKAKPKVDKVAEKKPDQKPETSEKVSEKQEIVTSSTEPPPAPEAKKPPEPKAKPAEAKPEKVEKVEEKVDPIAEALKKDEAKKKPEQQQKPEQKQADATPLPPKKPAPPQPKFDPSKIQTLLIDKRDPRRQAITGDVINTSASLGAATTNSPELSQDEIAALRARLGRLWSPPVAFAESGIRITIRFRLSRDKRLIGGPEVVTSGRGFMFEAARDAAVRAIFQAQPFDMLRPETYEAWNELEIVFDPSMMMRG